jgi:hypothetical protein
MIALVLALLCAQSPEPTREERVLELVERIRPAWYTQYGNARFQAQPAPLGDGTVFLPRFGVHCANSDDGTFDDGRARALARELFAIYGLETVRDVPLHDGERAAVVDGIAYPSKLGFELRGQGVSEMRGVARPEPDETALDARDHAWIAAQGFRLHVADVDDHRQVAGDGFTATLAYLAGLVHFLDAATAGEDVDLGGLLFEREGTWAWPVDEAVAGCADARVTDRRGRSLDLTVVRPCTLAFASTTAAWGPSPTIRRAMEPTQSIGESDTCRTPTRPTVSACFTQPTGILRSPSSAKTSNCSIRERSRGAATGAGISSAQRTHSQRRATCER